MSGKIGCGAIRPWRSSSSQTLLREEEVGGVVAVQVADLLAGDLERELPSPAGPASTPGQDVTSSVILRLAV